MASINRGDNTGAFGKEFLRIYLNNPNNLYIQKAVFQINGNLEKEYYEPKFPLRVNFSGAETEQLEQVNECRLALWDENGRRRTADGKFTFFVKENRISQIDAPNTYGDEYYPDDPDENSIVFDLEDAEFAAQFKIDATPSKMSELLQDIPIMTPDKIVAGDNISTYINQNEEVVISAQLDPTVRWGEIVDKPTINGKPLEGDVEIHIEGEIPVTDWDATSGPSMILNKPEFKRVCFTAHYNDIIGKPEEKVNLSQLNNDCNFITKTVNNLTNYYTKDQVEEKLDVRVDFTPIYDRINNDKQETDEKINEVENKIASKVDNQTFLDTMTDKADVQYVDDNLYVKANKSDIGNGTLNLAVNGITQTQFSANTKNNALFNVNVPNKVSELNNDLDFVTRDEVDLDNFITKEQLADKLADKADLSDIGQAILTIKQDGKQLTTFSSNAKTHKEVNIVTPQNLSDLTNDIGFITDTALIPLQGDIDAIETSISVYPTQINDLQKQLDNKVEREPGKGLISQAEIDRISTITEYDDTEVRNDITTLQNDLQQVVLDLDTKQNVIGGKSLSTNDFTDYYKESIDNAKIEITSIKEKSNTIEEEILSLKDKDNALTSQIEDVNVGLQDEIAIRQQKINDLQSQIEASSAKASVVDIVQSLEDLDKYDTSKLKNKDVICVLTDESHDNRTAYYRWNTAKADFDYTGAEGDYYTKSEANKTFVEKTFKINGKTLDVDFDLTAEDVGAIPNTQTIENGTLTVQRNGVQVGTFSANQATNETFDILVPTDTSQLTNGANYVNEDQLSSNIGQVNSSITTLSDDLELAKEKLDTLQGVITGDVSGLAEVAFTNSYNSLKDTPTIPVRLGQLQNDVGYVYTNGDVKDLSFILDEFEKRVKISKVSEIDNDRGYVTSTAIGRGVLTIKAQDKILGTWNANEKDDQEIVLPVDKVLSTTSENVVQNNTVTLELNKKAVDTEVVHKDLTEEITGDKTFSGDVTLSGNTIGATRPTADNSTHLATTQYVKSQDYCTNTNAVHKTLDENITGNKTFIGDVVLNNAVGITRIATDNSDNLATTKFVKDQQYSKDSTVVHNTGDETINGDKTFAETTTFDGITKLGQYAHVNTPEETGESKDYFDLVTNVEFVNNKVKVVDDRITSEVTTLNNTITTKDGTVVHKTGDETVAGVKTFSSTPILSTGFVNLKASTDVAIQNNGTNFLRKATGGSVVLSGTSTIYIRPNGDTNTTGQLQIDTDGTVTGTKFVGPLTGNVTGNVTGSSGSCTGNAATATKATQDANGNNIVNTYATKTALNGYVPLVTYNAKVQELTNLITALTARVEALENA